MNFLREWWEQLKSELHPPEKLTEAQAEFMHAELSPEAKRRMQLALLSSVNRDDREWGLS
jgi:hypothetical protein